MTSAQKVIKYMATAFAIFLIIAIVSTVLGAIYALSGILGLKSDNEQLSTGMNATSFESGNVSELNIDIAYTNLEIRTGTELKLETNNEKVTFKQNNETLEIKEKNHNWFSKNNKGDLIIYIPENVELEKVKLNAGAGKIVIENLNTPILSFELGAGEAEIENLTVSKECKIEGGAGKLEVLNGTINDLNLDMGIGEINLTAKLTGKNEINAGIGNLNIELTGNEENYKIQTNKGIGTVKIDGKEMSDGQKYGEGENHIDIDGGIGNIKVKFEE